MEPTTPSDVRLEFSDTVPPEVLGLLIKELSEPEPENEDLGIGGGPGILDLLIAVSAASAIPASVVVTVNGTLDLAERLRRFREKCREKGLPTDGDLTPFDEVGTSDTFQTGTAQQERSGGGPDERVRFLLRGVLEAMERATTGIEAIAQQEIDRLGRDTPEGEAWWLLAGQNPWSDWGRAYFAINDQLMAIRGSLTARGLDSNSKDYVPLNEQDNT